MFLLMCSITALCKVSWLPLSAKRQKIVRFLLDDLRGDRFLRPHRVDGDDGALDVHEPQKLGACRDFVRFLGTGHLTQRQYTNPTPRAQVNPNCQAFLECALTLVGMRLLTLQRHEAYIRREQRFPHSSLLATQERRRLHFHAEKL